MYGINGELKNNNGFHNGLAIRDSAQCRLNDWPRTPFIMNEIIIPIKLANAIFIVIIALMGNDLMKWLSNEMGWNASKSENGNKKSRTSFISKTRITIAETLRHLANKIDS